MSSAIMVTTSSTVAIRAHASSPLFEPLLDELPDVARYEVLPRLDPTSRALLRRAGRGCRAAVEAAVGLPRAGRGGSRLNRVDFEGTPALLAWAKTNGCPWDWLGVFLQEQSAADLFAAEVLWRLDPIDRTFLAQTWRLCRTVVLGSDLTRAGTGGGAVTHKLSEFCTSVGRLAWAKENGCLRPRSHMTALLDAAPWDTLSHLDPPGVCAYAAFGGRLDVLQWAREHGCPWNETTPWFAAAGGHLQVLQWRGSTGASGMRRRADRPLRAGTWGCCSGRGSVTARGIR